MILEQALLLGKFQEQDARTLERKNLAEILDKDNAPEKLEIV
jgi:hypothetical protein